MKDNLKEGSSWEVEPLDTVTPTKEQISNYDRLAQLEATDMEDFVNNQFGRGALSRFIKAKVKQADNEYETGRIDGLLEAIRIFRN